MEDLNRWNLIDSTGDGARSESEIPNRIETPNGAFEVEWKCLRGGRKHGIEMLCVDNGAIRVAILPTRGMGIWKCWMNDLEIGWQSPVVGPVHPQWVPINDPSGIGWLDGFDELLVRCGLESNGAPEFADNGQLRYPLHGRIANLATDRLTVEVNHSEDSMDIIGEVNEARFLVRGLRLQVRYRLHVHSPIVEITDTVTNMSAQPTSMQLLYHINIGTPILEEGSKVIAALSKLAPRDANAAIGIGHWDTCTAPESGFAEQVYYGHPIADVSGWNTALLQNRSGTRGVAVHFDTSTLPCLSLWKNTVAAEDGYVTGLEPATGFPNRRSFEESKGRVVPLAPGESRIFRLKVEPIKSQTQIHDLSATIRELQTSAGQFLEQPDPNWSEL